MSQTSLTLGSLLSAGDGAGTEDLWQEGALDAALPSLPLIDAGTLRQTVKQAVLEVIDVDLGEILTGAWNRYQELQKYRDSERYPADEIILVPMVEHTVRSIHSPAIEIVANDVPVLNLKFELDLSLELEGVVLKIAGGKIIEICAGSCQGRGQIKWRDAVLLDRETRAFDVPGAIDLGDGITIPAVFGDDELAGPEHAEAA